MTQQRKSKAKYGFLHSGEQRERLPLYFWEEQTWDIPEPPEERDYPILCIKSTELPKLIASRIHGVTIDNRTIYGWLNPSHKKWQIPGVYRNKRGSCSSNYQTWIHRDIARQMIEKLENDHRLMLKKPTAEDSFDCDKESFVQIKPVSNESIILQRIGGLKGMVSQLFGKVTRLEKEIELIKATRQVGMPSDKVDNLEEKVGRVVQ